MGLMGRVVLFGEGADAEDTLSRLVEALRYFQCKRLSLQELRLLSSQGYRVECDVLLVAFSADAACPEIVAEVRRCAGEAGVVVLSPEAKTDSGPSLLTAGADLWLPSTTEPLLLQASIAAIMRRLHKLWHADTTVALDHETSTVRIGHHSATLRRTPYRICQYLVSNRGRWISERELLREVLAMNHERRTSLVRVHVRYIRRALGIYGSCISSKRNVGYRFDSPNVATGQTSTEPSGCDGFGQEKAAAAG